MQNRAATWQTTLLGIVVVVAASLGAAGLFALGSPRLWGKKTLVLTATTDNARGLRAGTRVRVLGIPAGEVERVEVPQVPGQPVIVHFWIGGDAVALVRRDAILRLEKDGLLGERTLEIDPGSSNAPSLVNGDQLALAPSPDWDQLVVTANNILNKVENGEGSLSQLLNDKETYHELRKAIRSANEVVGSVREDYRSVQQTWPIKDWVTDRYKLLIRPDATLDREVFAANELFRPATAILSEAGKKRLDGMVPWIRQYDAQNSELVVVGYTRSEPNTRLAELTSTGQADAVLQYLSDTHGVHRTGWFTRRTVQAQGLGNLASPNGEQDLPPDRIELLMFVK